MKRLNNLRKSLPSNARLSNLEHTRIKGGNGDKRTGDDDKRPSNGNAWGKGSNNGNGNGNAHAYGHSK